MSVGYDVGMTQTYPAVVRDGRIEWVGVPPAGLPDGTAVRVEVVLPAPPAADEAERRQQMVAILQRIADRGTAFVEITDPVAWQREIRRDRPEPGRE